MVEVSRSTASLKVGQMVDYLTKIEGLAAENGLNITLPPDFRYIMNLE